ncbi:MAG: M6 family metalloprotease domain-containing protein [Bacteroidales bacterium]|nr:M6 family metalloprotease domain-containing protein [Bacteroidales bacterium]
MRKFIAILAALCCSLQLFAVPAYKGLIRHTQPDGSTIMIRMHGDEFCHWVTDASGKLLEMDADGYYRPASPSAVKVRRFAGQDKRSRLNAARRAAPRGVASGEKHFLVVLLSFSNKSFSISNPQTAFSNLMNQTGYSANGGTGSVKDFYYDNSHHTFTPVFDVVGPYQVSNTTSYYAGSSGTANAEIAFYEACQQANSDVDFSDYDLDGDGEVDMIFFYYAGYNWAEGVANTIWPHQYTFQATDYYNQKFDGKKLGSYACTSELKGASGTNMCGIGTACHEFGHAMGLPDFYDTDYEEYNGLSAGMFSFSTMDSGSYNNEGRTPPFFTIEERIMLGWLNEADAFRTFDTSGNYTLTSVDNNIAYKTPTDQNGEYFVYECRGANGWDAGLPAHGLIVTHVDKSSRKVTIYDSSGTKVTNQTAGQLWSDWETYNAINESGSHPCCYVVPAPDQENRMFGYSWDDDDQTYYYYSSNNVKIPFPGSMGVTSYTAKSWNGVDSDIQLSNIAYSNNQVTLYATVPSSTLNYNVIANPGNGVYSAGSSFALELVESEAQPVSDVAWFFDDEPVSGSSVTLTAGIHVVEAHLTLTTGATKILELTLTVN